MLAYLDALLDALMVRDRAAVERLLSHPLARVLPEAARDEARRIGGGTADPLAAPLRVMQLRHVTEELLRESPVVADHPEPPAPTAAPGHPRATARVTRGSRLVQMELPLSA